MSLSITGNRGFQLELKNGYVVSVQFGSTNYCERYGSCEVLGELKQGMKTVTSNDCELAVIKFGRGFVTGDILEAIGIDASSDGMVAGYVSSDDVARIIAYVGGLEND